MPTPATFQRIYPDSAGLEHPATEVSMRNVLTSMREAVDGVLPFRVRVRFDDGSVVTVKPREAAK